jgi:asparagine synthase (glutamine-hydrolysing)
VDCRLRRLTAPAALMMSAGFDTAAIAGLAGPAVTAQGRKLISLSWISSPGLLNARGDLRPWLEACHRAMPHLDVRQLSKPAENPLTGIEKRFMTNDGPSWSHHQLNLDIFAAAAAAGARLIMDGYGGDYTVNPRGRLALAYFLRRGQFRRLAAELRAHLRETGQPLWLTIKNELARPLLPVWSVRWVTWLRNGYRSSWTAPWVMRNVLYTRPGRKTPVRAHAAYAIPVTAARKRNAHLARRLSRGFAAGGYIPAAAYGLSLTRPFHDKRVVELGLAIPEELHVKDGLNRPIARRALADIYPQEFQHRDSKNVGMLSDDPAVLDQFTPELLAEANRLAKQSRLSAIFNFDTVRGLLSLPGPNESRWIIWRKSVAMRAVLLSRYVEWFNADNRS